MADSPNGLREQVRQLAEEVRSLRETRHEHAALLTRLAILVTAQEEMVKKLSADMEVAKLADQEMKTKWSLATALGALLGTLFVGLMLAIATGQVP
jgi:hypothetical protein